MTGLSVNENAVTLKTDTDLTDTEVRIVEDGASKRISADNLLGHLAPTTSGDVVNFKIVRHSNQKAVYSSGHLGTAFEAGVTNADSKGVFAYTSNIASTDSEALYVPFINLMADSLGSGHLAWFGVCHFYLNKGFPTGWSGGSGGATTPRILHPFDWSNITTFTTVVGGVKTADHIITIASHGFTNGQPVTNWVFTGHDTLNQSNSRGMPHSMGNTLFVEVLTPNTFRLHRNSGLSNPLKLLSANAPTAGTTGSMTYGISSSGVTLVTDNEHGMATGDFVKVTPTSGNLNAGYYPITRLSANTYTIKATNTTTGGATVRRNGWAMFIDSWDWHGHISIEVAWRDGTVNTVTGYGFGLGFPIVRHNGSLHHWVGCKTQFTNEAGTNVDLMLGRGHEDPYWALRLNSSDNFDLLNYDDAYNASGIFRCFRATGNTQFGSNTDLGAKVGFNTSSALNPLVGYNTSISGTTVTERKWQGRVATTSAGINVIKGLPAITDPSVCTAKGFVTVKDTTNTRVGFVRFAGTLKRVSASTTLVGQTIELVGSDIIGFFTPFNGTYSISGTTCTVISTLHGFSTNDRVLVRMTQSTGSGSRDGVYSITVVDANTFTFTHPSTTATGALVGNFCNVYLTASAGVLNVNGVGISETNLEWQVTEEVYNY